MYRTLLLAHLQPFGILTWVREIAIHLKCVLFFFNGIKYVYRLTELYRFQLQLYIECHILRIVIGIVTV
jgi:hypothetical protein